MNAYERHERLDRIVTAAKHITLVALGLFMVLTLLTLFWSILLLSALNFFGIIVGILFTIAIVGGAVWVVASYIRDETY